MPQRELGWVGGWGVTRGGQLPEQHETQDVLPKDLKPQDVLPKDLKPQDVLPKGLKLQTMISEKYWLRASRHQTLPHLVVTLQGAVTRGFLLPDQHET